MTFSSRTTAKLASVAGFLLLAGCANMYQPPARPATAYNPPSAALATMPNAAVTRYLVAFANNSSIIDADGQTSIDSAATLMQGNAALIATVIGSSDPVGSDASNMLLSKQRARAVHDALLHTGKVTEQRIETRWTGERNAANPAPGATPDAPARSVEIAVH
jgi:outer membrane protein OmpA-like peptidoglycan-associated protein